MLNTEITSTAVVPGTLYVKFVQFGPKLLFLGLIELYYGDFIANYIVEDFPIFFISVVHVNIFINVYAHLHEIIGGMLVT